MNAAVTFQIGLNESARAIRGKFTFAGAWESWCRMRTNSNVLLMLKIQFHVTVLHGIAMGVANQSLLV